MSRAPPSRYKQCGSLPLQQHLVCSGSRRQEAEAACQKDKEDSHGPRLKTKKNLSKLLSVHISSTLCICALARYCPFVKNGIGNCPGPSLHFSSLVDADGVQIEQRAIADEIKSAVRCSDGYILWPYMCELVYRSTGRTPRRSSRTSVRASLAASSSPVFQMRSVVLRGRLIPDLASRAIASLYAA